MIRLALVLTMLPVSALAGPLILPPEEYDRPYDGELYERTVSQEDIRGRCPSIKMAFALGCAIKDWIGPKTCLVLIAPDKDLKAAGNYRREDVRRHEIGHCLGWPADHRGARPTKD